MRTDKTHAIARNCSPPLPHPGQSVFLRGWRIFPMKSHTCEFTPRDLLRLVGWPLVPLALCAVVFHLGARSNLLPAPRPALDTERTILIHQADAARQPREAELLLLGDSSC